MQLAQKFCYLQLLFSYPAHTLFYNASAQLTWPIGSTIRHSTFYIRTITFQKPASTQPAKQFCYLLRIYCICSLDPFIWPNTFLICHSRFSYPHYLSYNGWAHSAGIAVFIFATRAFCICTIFFIKAWINSAGTILLLFATRAFISAPSFYKSLDLFGPAVLLFDTHAFYIVTTHFEKAWM